MCIFSGLVVELCIETVQACFNIDINKGISGHSALSKDCSSEAHLTGTQIAAASHQRRLLESAHSGQASEWSAVRQQHACANDMDCQGSLSRPF